MNRRSVAVMLNPDPTGAVCAWTAGVRIGLPMPDASMATSVTIDHDFAERMRRHVRGLEALIIGSSFQMRLRMASSTRDLSSTELLLGSFTNHVRMTDRSSDRRNDARALLPDGDNANE